MLDYHYSYAVGKILYAAAWAVFFALNGKFRVHMLLGSMLSAPFALCGVFFVPQYWHPPSLFDLNQRFGISIEDVAWCASVGGIATVAGVTFFREELDESHALLRRNMLLPVAAAAAAFAVLQIVHSQSSMNNLLVGFLTGGLIMAIERRDLVPYVLRGASAFTLVYFGLFYSVTLIYPDFVTVFFNLKNMTGIYVFGVPLEELELAFTSGVMWSALYPYSRGYTVKRFLLFRTISDNKTSWTQ